ncbi:hypothetical protein QBC42DRAFT_26114 [Cladorrhinum samala]|uniref:Uncharacterized protein n=1 Tax=Cladorrhinum samala TaxID=585594 RepID=A0AAV9I1D2_9PEZI|nr:hypothetical protein QBC42DRAFT_26114 [Cladorrhinum samala]
MTTEPDLEPQQVDLQWLAKLTKGQAFTPCAAGQPAKSLDFGHDGFTASLADSHQLMQITRPDATCGITFVRGAFPDRPESILSRAQGNGQDTFGVCVLPATQETDVQIEERKTQGWINFRWPYAQYGLIRRDSETREIAGYGTYEIISFARDGVVTQIHRLQWGHGSSEYEYGNDDSSRPPTPQDPATARIRLGGAVRFGCPCSSGRPGNSHDSDSFVISAHDGELRCKSTNYDTALKIRFSENGLQRQLVPTNYQQGVEYTTRTGPWVDLSCEETINLPVGDAVYLVLTYSIEDGATHPAGRHDLETRLLPDDLQNYLGVAEDSPYMTDRLWTALCGPNYEAVEAVELCVVGKCVEQILGVTSVPLAPVDDTQYPQTALISNIMTSQYVDVQSAFFQIRLLAKAYRFIDSRDLESDYLYIFGNRDELLEIRDHYLERLADVIRKSLSWLFATDLRQERLLLAVNSRIEPQMTGRLQSCLSKREHLTWDTSYNRGCYATMAAWYVCKTCPAVITQTLAERVILPLLPRGYELGVMRARRNKQPTSKGNVLQWLHFSCILLLHEKLGNGERDSGHSWADRVQIAQREFENHVSRLKTSQVEGWSAEHDELDYVLLLADEMGLDLLANNRNSHRLARSRAKQTIARLRSRKPTTKYHPGPTPWMAARSVSNGPWELLAIHHEAYLKVSEDETQAAAARDLLFEFLLSDYSFMASWDRADANWIGTWWDIEPVAMICATLLDLKDEGKLRAARRKAMVPSMGHYDEDQDDTALSGSISTLRRSRTGTGIVETAAGTLDPSQAALVAAFKQSMMELMDQISDAGTGKAASVDIDWIKSRPGAVCLPEWWVNYQQSRDASVRKSLACFLEYHKSQNFLAQRPFPGYEDLRSLNVFDISQPSGYFWFCSVQLRCGSQAKPDPSNRMFVGPWSLPVMSGGEASPLLAADHKLKEYPSGNEVDGVLEIPVDGFVAALDKGLLDLGVKFRIFCAPEVTPPMAANFIHKWHPDALDSIDDYFGTSSRFIDYFGTNRWITSISVSHWTMRIPRGDGDSSYVEMHRQRGTFPPDNIVKLGELPSILDQYTIEEHSSTLIVTGYPSGHGWIMSIWSGVTDAESIAALVKDVACGVMDKFIHQQATGRCLVFLVFLGHLCNKLAIEYNNLLTELDQVMGIGNKTLLEGLEDWWGTSEAVNKLKKMLWGWEALRVFNDKLSSSLSQIQRAQDVMERYVRQHALQQDADLIQETNNVLDDFKKRYGRLTDVHDRTQLKIKQVTGLRDGISTITNVLDNKTTIQQGNNVRVLTYITIAYLPLGFVIGLYSIQHGSFMNGASNGLFYGLLIAFSVLTWILAYLLEKALVRFQLIKAILWPAVFRRTHEKPDWLGRKFGDNPRKPSSTKNTIDIELTEMA